MANPTTEKALETEMTNNKINYNSSHPLNSYKKAGSMLNFSDVISFTSHKYPMMQELVLFLFVVLFFTKEEKGYNILNFLLSQ